jgi:hypothetical protein
MRLTPNAPVGQPSFQLSADEIATVVDLACRAAHEARGQVHSGMLEVPITIVIRKAIRRIKKAEGLTNLQVRGEHELEDMATVDPALLGRIDITLQFLRQFGDEDDYVAIECKRVGAGLNALNARYVSEGVHRFVTGQYSAGHAWAFMLGYVLALPVDQPHFRNKRSDLPSLWSTSEACSRNKARSSPRCTFGCAGARRTHYPSSTHFR